MITITEEWALREHMLKSAAWVREQLRRADLGCNFELTIKVEGAIQQNDVKLKYTLDHTRNYDSSVSGNSLSEVTFELLRRSGWKASNDGLLLTYAGDADDTVPAPPASLEEQF